MKSVSFPVSWLNPLSEIINEEAGVSSSEILSTVSWGISMRLRTALALSGDGTDRAGCLTGASRSFLGLNDSRILRGPFEKRRDRPLERPAQIGAGIFDSQSSPCKHRSRY